MWNLKNNTTELIYKQKQTEEPGWWRNRSGRPLSPLQIHRKNI